MIILVMCLSAFLLLAFVLFRFDEQTKRWRELHHKIAQPRARKINTGVCKNILKNSNGAKTVVYGGIY